MSVGLLESYDRASGPLYSRSTFSMLDILFACACLVYFLDGVGAESGPSHSLKVVQIRA